MNIGVVILNYNDAQTTLQLLKKVHPYNISQIIVVDNNSTDNSYDILAGYTDRYNFKLIKADKNGGYSYGNNIGIDYLLKNTDCDIIIIANPDIIFEEDILGRIKRHFNDNPKCGLVSPLMLDRCGNRMRMWLKLPTYINSIFDCSFAGRQLNKLIRRTSVDYSNASQKVDILPGSLLAFRASTLKDIGGFDDNVFLYYEENIIGEKMKTHGYDTALLTDCSYIHNHSVTIKKNLSILNAFKCNLKSKLYFEKTYHKIGKFREFMLKACMKYAVVEMAAILNLRSVLKK